MFKNNIPVVAEGTLWKKVSDISAGDGEIDNLFYSVVRTMQHFWTSMSCFYCI